MRAAAVLLAVPLAAACSQHVYAPPSRAHVIAPVRTLPDQHRALELDVARLAGLFDPEVDTGAGRLRFGVGNDTEVSVEGTVAHVDDRGPSRAVRNFYLGRVGVRRNPRPGPFSVFAGAGGGYAPAGGTFVSADAGVAVGYHNCVLVPVLEASGFASRPLSPRPVDVTDDPGRPTYDTPRLTYGMTGRGGLRLSLTPDACRRGESGAWLTGGLTATTLADADSHDGVMGVGFGVEIPLE